MLLTVFFVFVFSMYVTIFALSERRYVKTQQGKKKKAQGQPTKFNPLTHCYTAGGTSEGLLSIADAAGGAGWCDGGASAASEASDPPTRQAVAGHCFFASLTERGEILPDRWWSPR